jgi:hypothetical protein
MYVCMYVRVYVRETIMSRLKDMLMEVTKLNRVLLEKLIVAEPLKKSALLYGTRRFITVFRRARCRSLS